METCKPSPGDGPFAGRGPKMVEPTRTLVLPRAMASSKSADIPMLSSGQAGLPKTTPCSRRRDPQSSSGRIHIPLPPAPAPKCPGLHRPHLHTEPPRVPASQKKTPPGPRSASGTPSAAAQRRRHPCRQRMFRGRALGALGGGAGGPPAAVEGGGTDLGGLGGPGSPGLGAAGVVGHADRHQPGEAQVLRGAGRGRDRGGVSAVI